MTNKVQGKTRPANFVAASSKEEAEQLIKQIGEARRDVLRIEADMNDKVAQIKHDHEQLAEPIKEQIGELLAAVQVYAEANRDNLTRGGKSKSVQLATGELVWRTLPPKVTIRNKQRVMGSCHTLGLNRFIRTSEEINKDAMLAEPEVAQQIAGVTIASAGETFSVDPYELEIEDKQ